MLLKTRITVLLYTIPSSNPRQIFFYNRRERSDVVCNMIQSLVKTVAQRVGQDAELVIIAIIVALCDYYTVGMANALGLLLSFSLTIRWVSFEFFALKHQLFER